MHDYVQKRKPPGSQELFSSSSPPPLGSKRETLPLASFGSTKRMKRDPRDEIVPESRVWRGNFMSKTELKTYIGHRKECKCVTFKCLDFTFFTVANLCFQLSY